MRLQKYIAKCGIASRRSSEGIILQGRVSVNGKIIKELGTKINPEDDIVKVDNKTISLESEQIYIVLNKPVGYITTAKDQFNRPTVIDLIKDVKERVFPVGRLDYDTSGLLILTNDGELTYKLTHPKHEINKTYIAKLKGNPTLDELLRFRNGLKIEDYITSKSFIDIIKKYDNSCLAKITIHEGKNRQIRKMCDAINHTVLSLKRIEMGNIKLNDIKIGSWRYMTNSEIQYLKSL